MKYLGRKIIFFLIILIPFWSFLVWFFYPKTELPGIILDKTVLDRSGVEHRSFNWITTNKKLTKPDGSQYEISDDYYGFFPVNRPEYVVKDLSVFNNREVDSLAEHFEFLYYTDAYGIYTNEWVYGRDINERSRLVYGGLNKQSYRLFEKMFRNRKLVLTEFNNLASPTPLSIRQAMQRVLESDFTGWTGRYYHSLDTLLNPDIPSWMRRLHRQYYKRPFAYDDIPGIVFVHETERIFVLQLDLDLKHELPIINTGDWLIKKYGLPEFIRYPYWFDVNFAKDTANVRATYKIHTTEHGDSILASHGLPNEFPAVLGDHKENLRWYFCGDWADSPTPFGLSYFKGVQFVRKFFYNNRDELDRKKFFWEYYEPLVSGIFDDYVDAMDTLEGPRPLPPVHRNYEPYYRQNNIPLPNVDLIASGRRYDPNRVYGSEYKEQAYRDSVLQAEKEEASRTGYYIGQYGDTVYLSDDELEELENQARYEEFAKQRRDSLSRRRLDSIRGVGEFSGDIEYIRIDSAYLRGGRLPVTLPLTSAELSRRSKLRAEAQRRRDSLARITLDSIMEVEAEEALPEALRKPSPVDSSFLRGGRIPNKKPLTQEEIDAQKAQQTEIILDDDEETYEAPESENIEEDSPEQIIADDGTVVLPNYNRFSVGGRMAKGVFPSQANEEESPSSEAEETGRWHIILGDFKDKTDVDDFMAEIEDSQVKVLYFPELDFYRVSYRSYKDRAKAEQAQLNIIGRYRKSYIIFID